MNAVRRHDPCHRERRKFRPASDDAPMHKGTDARIDEGIDEDIKAMIVPAERVAIRSGPDSPAANY
jgi:hypothetical protein